MARGQDSPADPIEAKNLNDFLCFVIYSTNLAVNRYEQDDQTVGDLAEKLFLDSSTLTPLLKRLETMGHVTRQRDPQDERQVRLRLTSQGRNVRERAFAFRHDLVKAMGLSAADFQHLREQMVKLRANLSDAVRENP